MGNGAQIRVMAHHALKATWAALLIAMMWSTAAGAACRPSEVVLTGPFGEARFSVEVARTPEEQGRGLMFREEMAASAGMIFVYETPRNVSFWMRNTLIPLDMIFIDVTGRVTQIHANAVPLDETPIPSQSPVVGVLEINGGLAAQIGIAPGALVQHPGLPQSQSLFPC